MVEEWPSFQCQTKPGHRAVPHRTRSSFTCDRLFLIVPAFLYSGLKTIPSPRRNHIFPRLTVLNLINMTFKLFYLALIGLCCSSCTFVKTDNPGTETLPAGITVMEQHPTGNFIRLTTVNLPDSATLVLLTRTLSSFTRIDLCHLHSHARGDEYLSIIAGKVYDYETDSIYKLY